MDKKQFDSLMTVLTLIAENTKPAGKKRQVLEWIGLIVTICGGFTVVELIAELVIKFIGGLK
jgi:hypothetical protein